MYQTWALHSENRFKNPSDSPSLYYIACGSLTVSSWDSPGRKMLLELAALFRESFTKMLSSLLWHRLVHSEDRGDLLRSQGTSSWHKPRLGLCQTSRSYWKTEVQWDLWSYLKLSSWEVECQGLWKTRYFSFLSKTFEKILGHVLPVVYNRLNEESIFMGSSLFKIKREDREMWINDTTFNHTVGVHIAQHVREGNPQHVRHLGEVGTVAFRGCHESYAGNSHTGLPPAHVLLSTLNHACTQALLWLLLHTDLLPPDMSSSRCFSISFNQINQLLLLSGHWLCGMYFRTRSVLPSYLPPRQLCSWSKGIVSSLTCWGTYILFSVREALFIPLHTLHCTCVLSKMGLEVVPSLGRWQGQTCPICFGLVSSSKTF